MKYGKTSGERGDADKLGQLFVCKEPSQWLDDRLLRTWRLQKQNSKKRQRRFIHPHGKAIVVLRQTNKATQYIASQQGKVRTDVC